MQISPKTVYHNLRLLDRVDLATSAFYRQLAQEVLADSQVSLVLRQAISHRLERANRDLALLAVGSEESY
ncbi:MAG: hypothetical protein SVX43_07900 [Cyanobacteriota bacterium]|nr:hypothetical protein [Cyanobacteriota bacterium]